MTRKTHATGLVLDLTPGSYFDPTKQFIDFLRTGQNYFSYTSGQYEDKNGYFKDMPSGVTASCVLVDYIGNGGAPLYHRTGTFYVRYPARFTGSSYIDAYTPGNNPVALSNQTLIVSGGWVLYTFDTTTQQAITIEFHNGSGAPMSLGYDEISVHRAEHDHLVWDTPGSASGNWLPAGTRQVFNPDWIDMHAGAEYIRALDMVPTNTMLGYPDGPPSPANPIRFVDSELPLGVETDVSPYNHRIPFGGYNTNFRSDGTYHRDFGCNNMANPRLMGEMAAAVGCGLWYPIPPSLVSIDSDYTALGLVLDQLRIGLGGTLPFLFEYANEPWNDAETFVRSKNHILAIGAALNASGHPLTCIANDLTSVSWASADTEERLAATLAHITLRIRDMALARFNASQVKCAMNGHVVLPLAQGKLWTRYVETVGVNAGKRACQIVDYACVAPYFNQVFSGPHIDAIGPIPPYTSDPEDRSRDAYWLALFKGGIDIQVGYIDAWNSMLDTVNATYNGTMQLICYEGGMGLENKFVYYGGPDATIDTITDPPHNLMQSLETQNGVPWSARGNFQDGEQWNNFYVISGTNEPNGNPVDGSTGGAQVMKFRSGSDTLIEMYSDLAMTVRYTLNGDNVNPPGTVYHSTNGSRYEDAPTLIASKMDGPVQAQVLAYQFTSMRGKVRLLAQYVDIGKRPISQLWGAINTQDNGLNPALEMLNGIKLKGVGSGIPV